MHICVATVATWTSQLQSHATMLSFWRRRKSCLCTHSNKAQAPVALLHTQLRSHRTTLYTFVSTFLPLEHQGSSAVGFRRGRNYSLPMPSDKALAPVAPTHTHLQSHHTHVEGLCLPAHLGLWCFTFSQSKTLVLSLLVASLSRLFKHLGSPPLFQSLSV